MEDSDDKAFGPCKAAEKNGTPNGEQHGASWSCSF